MKTYTLSELATHDGRREHIGKLMLSGDWSGAGSRRLLAEAWAMKLADVMRLENEAAGAIRLARKPGWEDDVTVALAQLDELMALCRTLQKPVVVDKTVELFDAPAVAVIHAALRTKLQVFGALGQPAAKAKPDESGDAYERLSHAERAKRLREAADAEDMAEMGARH